MRSNVELSWRGSYCQWTDCNRLNCSVVRRAIIFWLQLELTKYTLYITFTGLVRCQSPLLSLLTPSNVKLFLKEGPRVNDKTVLTLTIHYLEYLWPKNYTGREKVGCRNYFGQPALILYIARNRYRLSACESGHGSDPVTDRRDQYSPFTFEL
jgi:hypothetical protein